MEIKAMQAYISNIKTKVVGFCYERRFAIVVSLLIGTGLVAVYYSEKYHAERNTVSKLLKTVKYLKNEVSENSGGRRRGFASVC